MSGLVTYLDTLFFAVLPYVAMVVFLIGTILRYRAQSFTYSSLSSQLLENRDHFWAMVPFHYGVITVIAGHAVAFLIPGSILLWNARPMRLYILEASALAAGLLTLIGFFAIVARRLTNPKVRVVTTTVDWIVYALLLVSIGSGVGIALWKPWGSSWFAASATPYLWSLLTLRPNIAWVTPMPWLVKVHFINAWLLIGFFPLSRLVHILVVPNQYLWRKKQVVRWYGRPGVVPQRGSR